MTTPPLPPTFRVSRPRATALVAGLCVATVPIGFLASAGVGRADVFTWKDGRTAKVRILAEFRDSFYVQADSELARFVPATELTQVLGDDGRPRDVSRTAEPTPALAVDSVVGDVQVVGRGAPRAVTSLAFAGVGERVVTTEDGLARLVLPSQATVNLGSSSSVASPRGGEDADRLDLEAGEVFVTASEKRPFRLALPPARGEPADLRVRAQGASVEVSRKATAREWRVAVHSGEARLEGDTFQVRLAAGQSVSLSGLPEGLQVTSESTNAAALELAHGARTLSLAPGSSHLVEGSASGRLAGAWRLARVQGVVSIRHGAQPGAGTGFVAVAAHEAEHVRLESGDAVATDPASEALLVRDDGASVSLGETSELELAHLALAAGSMRVDALRDPLGVTSPAGEARLVYATLEARRPRARDARSMELKVKKGTARLPLPAALAVATEGTSFAVEGDAEEAKVRAGEGGLKILSRATAETSDPEAQAALESGQSITVRTGKAGLVFVLDGDRTVGFGPERTGARLTLGSAPAVAFPNGVVCLIEKKTLVQFGVEREAPVARLPGGERIGLEPVGQPISLDGSSFAAGGTTLDAKGGAAATLRRGEGLAGMTLRARRDDRLEIPRGTSATLATRPEIQTLKLADGRGLWIHEAAPTVHMKLIVPGTPVEGLAGIRAADERGSSLALSMPGVAPLVIAPTRRVTVLATRDGEFLILDDPSMREPLQELAGAAPTLSPNSSSYIPELVSEPPPTSPTTPPP